MNEKFFVLADEVKWDSNVSYGELMRYAALIVKECARVCENEKDSQRILEHFGVK